MISYYIPNWLDWLAGIGSTVGIPALLFSVWTLFRKNKETQQQIQSLSTLAEEAQDQSKYLASIVEALTINKQKILIEDRPRLSTGSGSHVAGSFTKRFINQAGTAKTIEIIESSENISFKGFKFFNKGRGESIEINGIFVNEPITGDKYKLIFQLVSEMDITYYQKFRCDGKWKGHMSPPSLEKPTI